MLSNDIFDAQKMFPVWFIHIQTHIYTHITLLIRSDTVTRYKRTWLSVCQFVTLASKWFAYQIEFITLR